MCFFKSIAFAPVDVRRRAPAPQGTQGRRAKARREAGVRHREVLRVLRVHAREKVAQLLDGECVRLLASVDAVPRGIERHDVTSRIQRQLQVSLGVFEHHLQHREPRVEGRRGVLLGVDLGGHLALPVLSENRIGRAMRPPADSGPVRRRGVRGVGSLPCLSAREATG